MYQIGAKSIQNGHCYKKIKISAIGRSHLKWT